MLLNLNMGCLFSKPLYYNIKYSKCIECQFEREKEFKLNRKPLFNETLHYFR